MRYINSPKYTHDAWTHIFGRMIIVLLGLTSGTALWATQSSSAHAQANLNCSSQFLIDETLPSGARWQLCWEYRARDGIILREITFTPVNGTPRMVLFEASIAQIHVPYDDNGARYHDVTDYGLGSLPVAPIMGSMVPSS